MFLDTPCICECIVRVSLKPPSAVYFNAVADIDPHAARALYRPVQNWKFQPYDVPCDAQFSYFCYDNNKQQISCNLFACLRCCQTF